jgi:hypothetical protein
LQAGFAVTVGTSAEIAGNIGYHTDLAFKMARSFSNTTSNLEVVTESNADDQSVTFKCTVTAAPGEKLKATVSYTADVSTVDYRATISIDGVKRIISGEWKGQLIGHVELFVEQV